MLVDVASFSYGFGIEKKRLIHIFSAPSTKNIGSYEVAADFRAIFESHALHLIEGVS